MDVDDIAPGKRFAETIAATIAGCKIVLVVIGPRWAEILRQRAQEQQRDYVREEIEAALTRQVTIVPILVGGANVKELAGLPDQMAALSQYEAAELRDNTFNEDCARLAKGLRLGPTEDTTSGKRSRRKLWFAAAAAAVLLSLGWVAIGPWSAYRSRQATLAEIFATARTQEKRGEYETAFATLAGALKIEPRNRAAIDGQVDSAMRWLEDFHVIAPAGTEGEHLAAARLDQIIPVLDAALARTSGQGQRAADILAHLGWAHWLNEKMAYREFDDAAEKDLREALRLDPSNVFANAMLGNWLMQTDGSTEEAIGHFRTAVAQNKERPFVRALQLAELVYSSKPETRAEMMRVANDMRRNGEPLDARQRNGILNAYSPTMNSDAELHQSLSAIPPEDAWATYLWVDHDRGDDTGDYRRMRHDFIQAEILEIEGKRQEALGAFQKLRGELKNSGFNGRIVRHIETAITRLSKG